MAALLQAKQAPVKRLGERGLIQFMAVHGVVQLQPCNLCVKPDRVSISMSCKACMRGLCRSSAMRKAVNANTTDRQPA